MDYNQINKTNILINLSKLVSADVLLETFKYLSLEQLQEIMFLNKKFYYSISYSNNLFRYYFLQHETNLKMSPWSKKSILECASFVNSPLYKTMCRLVSFKPTISFENEIKKLPLIQLNGKKIEVTTLTKNEQHLFKIADFCTTLQTNQETANYKSIAHETDKWNTHFGAFQKNLNLKFDYWWWKFILKHCYLVGNSVLTCLLTGINRQHLPDKELNFWIHNIYNKIEVKKYIYRVIKRLGEKNTVISVPANCLHETTKSMALYPFFYQRIIFVHFRNYSKNLNSMKNFEDTDITNIHYIDEKAFATWKQSKKEEFSWIKIQFIWFKGIYSLNTLLPTFYIDLSQIGFDGKNIQVTPAAYRSMQTNTIIIYKLKNNPINSENITSRVFKYTHDFKMTLLVPKQLELDSMLQKCNTKKKFHEYEEQYNRWFENNECTYMYVQTLQNTLQTSHLETCINVLKQYLNFDWFNIKHQFVELINSKIIQNQS